MHIVASFVCNIQNTRQDRCLPSLALTRDSGNEPGNLYRCWKLSLNCPTLTPTSAFSFDQTFCILKDPPTLGFITTTCKSCICSSFYRKKLCVLPHRVLSQSDVYVIDCQIGTETPLCTQLIKRDWSFTGGQSLRLSWTKTRTGAEAFLCCFKGPGHEQETRSSDVLVVERGARRRPQVKKYYDLLPRF